MNAAWKSMARGVELLVVVWSMRQAATRGAFMEHAINDLQCIEFFGPHVSMIAFRVISRITSST